MSHFNQRRVTAGEFGLGAPVAAEDTVSSAPDYPFDRPLQVKRRTRVNNNASTESLGWVRSYSKKVMLRLTKAHLSLRVPLRPARLQAGC